MNSENHPAAYGYKPPVYGSHFAPKPRIQEYTLQTGEIQVERKTFSFGLKENPRGRFLRITEFKGDFHQSLVIPATGLRDFQKLLAEMLAADATHPINPPLSAV